MPRSLVFGNGSMLVTLDNKLMIRDFYYPRVGMEDHTSYGHFHRIGVWVDNHLSWLHTNEWHTERIGYEENTLCGNSMVKNDNVGLSIEFVDCVDSTETIFIRKLIIHNNTDRERNIRMFFHQDFHIYGEKLQDTALYEPTSNSVIHYRKKRYFLVNGKCGEEGLSTYTVGKTEFKDLEGTWRDAEDGSLHRNPVVQGSVDSTVGMNVHIEPNGTTVVYYWLCAGRKFSEITQLNQLVLDETPEKLIKRSNKYWMTWVNKQEYPCLKCISPEVEKAFKHSLLIVRTQIDNGGAIIAANDSDIMKFNKDTYTYMWPRDGALVANILDQVGHGEIAQRFYQFCADVITDAGFLLHKYNPDKSLGSSWHPWFRDNEAQLPIQEDETALPIFALGQHYKMFKDLEFLRSLYEPLVKKGSDFMCEYINPVTNLPHPSYGLWEEHRGVFTFTCSTVYAGLKAASELAHAVGDTEHAEKCAAVAEKVKAAILEHLWDDTNKRFYKYIKSDLDGNITHRDSTIEASCYAIWYFGVLPADDERVVSQMQQMKDHLWVKTEVGGMARYQNDYYHMNHQHSPEMPGNPWYITTLWYARWLGEVAKNPNDLSEAFQIFDWCLKHSLDSYIMPEQLDVVTGEHISVSPLTWSHATFVETVFQIATKYDELNAQNAPKDSEGDDKKE